MLDAYIIDRIRREREKRDRDGAFVPLHIEQPHDHDPIPRNHEEDKERDERGSIVIDFQV